MFEGIKTLAWIIRHFMHGLRYNDEEQVLECLKCKEPVLSETSGDE